ncbi:MAG TPA: hypothetical protein VMH81_04360 [Bryobacteraceae bacterium]|nr:hypothetical protein [Bryobacteraceae bacterium]
MTRFECEFEADVLAAALQDRWPERVDPELRAHVATCAICSDIASIGKAIEEDREAHSASAVIPDSGRVWWMAQLRARREAAEAANRPLTIALVAALVGAAGVLGACFRAAFTWFHGVAGRIAADISSFDLAGWLSFAGKLLAEHGALALAMAAILLLLPAAYLAIGRD